VRGKIKLIMKNILTIVFAMILLLPSFAFAEVKIFEKEYTYQASEIDSKVTSRAIAVEQVKRLEIIGTDTIKSK